MLVITVANINLTYPQCKDMALITLQTSNWLSDNFLQFLLSIANIVFFQPNTIEAKTTRRWVFSTENVNGKIRKSHMTQLNRYGTWLFLNSD